MKKEMVRKNIIISEDLYKKINKRRVNIPFSPYVAKMLEKVIK